MKEIVLHIKYCNEFIRDEYILHFKCKKNNVFLDLYEFIDKELNIEDSSSEYTRFAHIFVNGNLVTPIDNFQVIKFIEINGLDFNDFKIEYSYGGIGGGEYLNDKLKIEIRASEKNHNESAYIHISNCKGNNQVVFSLFDLKIIEGFNNWKKTFNRKEKKEVEKMLKKYQNEFLTFYKTQLLGIVPKAVEFEYDGRYQCLSYNNETY